jgi:hypothetical protein
LWVASESDESDFRANDAGDYPGAAVPGAAGRSSGAGLESHWINALPASGGLLGALLGVLCLWIGAKRAYRALFQFEASHWMTLRLAKLAVTTWVVMKTETSEGMREKESFEGVEGRIGCAGRFVSRVLPSGSKDDPGQAGLATNDASRR